MAFDIAAFSMWVSSGLIPQARHGARGEWGPAVVGSKFEGTGFEKLQIGHIQVAVVVGEGSGVGRWNWPSTRDNGDELALRDGSSRFGTRVSVRFGGLGTSVIFAEDLRNPAYAKY